MLTAAVIMACVLLVIFLMPSESPEQQVAAPTAPLETTAQPEVPLQDTPPATVPEELARADRAPRRQPLSHFQTRRLQRRVRRGDNLSLIFKRAGYNDGDVYQVVSQAPDGKDLARIFPGQTIAFRADEQGQLTAIRHVKSALVTVDYTLRDGSFDSQVHQRTPEARETW
jgi:cell envelope opacity-associated protein A